MAVAEGRKLKGDQWQISEVGLVVCNVDGVQEDRVGEQADEIVGGVMDEVSRGVMWGMGIEVSYGGVLIWWNGGLAIQVSEAAHMRLQVKGHRLTACVSFGFIVIPFPVSSLGVAFDSRGLDGRQYDTWRDALCDRQMTCRVFVNLPAAHLSSKFSLLMFDRGPLCSE